MSTFYTLKNRPHGQGSKRNSNGNSREFGFRADNEMADAIVRVAKRHNVTTSEAIRMLIEWGLDGAGDQ